MRDKQRLSRFIPTRNKPMQEKPIEVSKQSAKQPDTYEKEKLPEDFYDLVWMTAKEALTSKNEELRIAQQQSASNEKEDK